MQLFAIACRKDGSVGELGLEAAIADVAARFPQLAGCDLHGGESRDGRLAFAAASHPAPFVGKRRYLQREGEEVTLFDGLPAEREGRFEAFDAAVLGERWRALPGSLEGIFSAVRIDLGAAEVECLTDPVGMAKVYLARDSSGWLLANSVEAIHWLSGLDRPNPLGVSAVVSMGWPAAGTMIDGVRPLAGGCLHTLSPERYREQPYFAPAGIAPRNNRSLIGGAGELAERLKVTTAAVVAPSQAVSCALTAGRDSRVAFALMLALGMRSIDYYTAGAPGEPDVEMARMLAREAEVEHRLASRGIPPQADRWREQTVRFALQTEGMASLYAISDHLDHGDTPAPLGLKIWGAGGESARAGIGMLAPFVGQMPGLRASWEVQKRTLTTKTSSRDGVVRPEALETARRYLREFVERRREEGWRAREALEAYYAFERVGNWASTGVRRVSGATDLFSPFVTCDFYEYAFSLQSGERYVEAAHYRLLSVLSESLRDQPFEKPWKAQRPRLAPAMAIAAIADAAAGRVRQRVPRRARAVVTPAGGAIGKDFGRAWLEAGIDQHRELCASFPDSPLWDYVDRGRLDSMLAASPAARRPYAEGLCAVLTPFWYFHGHMATT